MKKFLINFEYNFSITVAYSSKFGVDKNIFSCMLSIDLFPFMKFIYCLLLQFHCGTFNENAIIINVWNIIFVNENLDYLSSPLVSQNSISYCVSPILNFFLLKPPTIVLKRDMHECYKLLLLINI